MNKINICEVLLSILLNVITKANPMNEFLLTCDGSGNGNQPVNGTNNGTEVIPSHLYENKIHGKAINVIE